MSPPSPGPEVDRPLRRIPRGIWVLGFVSMLMDVSSEMIHALLPVYLVVVFRASALTVGLIEGMAEATAAITKVFSGTLSDWLGRRKLLAALGYGLAALTKPIFPLAPSLAWLVTARFIDRVGKGVRGAPRDALLADLAPPDLRGASFGLRQALDTAGAFLGPLFAIALMWWTADAFETVFWFAAPPAFLAFALILFGVKEPASAPGARSVTNPLSKPRLRQLGSRYWWVVLLGILLTFSRFSEAFLILRTKDAGLPLMWMPAVLVLMNLVYALAAYPAAALSDRVDRVHVLRSGVAMLILAHLALAALPGIGGALIGVVLWGLHMAFSQGLLASLVADTVQPELRGTGFGFFNLLAGAAMLVSNALAGGLWDLVGPAGTFFVGAAFASLTLLLLSWKRARLEHPRAVRED